MTKQMDAVHVRHQAAVNRLSGLLRRIQAEADTPFSEPILRFALDETWLCVEVTYEPMPGQRWARDYRFHPGQVELSDDQRLLDRLMWLARTVVLNVLAESLLVDGRTRPEGFLPRKKEVKPPGPNGRVEPERVWEGNGRVFMSDPRLDGGKPLEVRSRADVDLIVWDPGQGPTQGGAP